MGSLKVLLISTCAFLGVLEAQKCPTCQIREFTKKTQACICPENLFCNITTKKCKKCDSCYDNWNENIKQRKIKFEDILSQILSKYEINFPEIQKLLNMLKTNLQKREIEFGSLESLQDQVEKKILKVNDLSNQLKNDLNKVKELLKNLTAIKPLKDVELELKKIKNNLKTIQDRLNELISSIGDLELTEIEKINNINQDLETIKNNFPVLEKDSLNLAFSLESDLELLETIISDKNSIRTDKDFPNDFELKLNWIEKDLVWLFNLLNNYNNASLDLDNLNKQSIKAKTEAENIRTKLDELISKHQNFENQLNELKIELEFYESLKELFNRFSKKISNELDKLNKEREIYMNKIKIVNNYREKLENLLTEETELLEIYQKIGVNTVDELSSNIQSLTTEVKEITDFLKTHCTAKKDTMVLIKFKVMLIYLTVLR